MEKKKVLVIGNDNKDRRALCLSLTGIGCVYDCVFGGDDAAIQFRTIEYDLVLMDVFLPNWENISTMEAIKRLRSDIPVVAISTLFRPWIKEILLDSGFDNLLLIPFRVNQLQIVLQDYFDDV
ncbi:MAG: response regulator [bacterium]|nr:response regulator [bacterium]